MTNRQFCPEAVVVVVLLCQESAWLFRPVGEETPPAAVRLHAHEITLAHYPHTGIRQFQLIFKQQPPILVGRIGCPGQSHGIKGLWYSELGAHQFGSQQALSISPLHSTSSV